MLLDHKMLILASVCRTIWPERNQLKPSISFIDYLLINNELIHLEPDNFSWLAMINQSFSLDVYSGNNWHTIPLK